MSSKTRATGQELETWALGQLDPTSHQSSWPVEGSPWSHFWELGLG